MHHDKHDDKNRHEIINFVDGLLRNIEAGLQALDLHFNDPLRSVDVVKSQDFDIVNVRVGVESTHGRESRDEINHKTLFQVLLRDFLQVSDHVNILNESCCERDKHIDDPETINHKLQHRGGLEHLSWVSADSKLKLGLVRLINLRVGDETEFKQEDEKPNNFPYLVGF